MFTPPADRYLMLLRERQRVLAAVTWDGTPDRNDARRRLQRERLAELDAELARIEAAMDIAATVSLVLGGNGA